jgi:hypothetical protein
MYEYIPKQELMAGIYKLENVEFVIFPNPSNGSFTIHSKSTKIKTIQVYTTDGRCIQTIENSDFQKITLDRSNLTKGIYIVACIDKQGSFLGTQQLILY